jgi:ribosome-associated protein
MPDDIFINNLVTIPASELEFTASRSSGPGGQHVNKTESRIQVRWNVPDSVAMSDFLKKRVIQALATRLTDGGDLLLASEAHRSQHRNREEVLQRLAALVREALIPPKPRRKTKPTRASKLKRLDDKRRRADVKKGRGKKYDGAD